MSQNKRVVITGMGALSPIGNDVKTTWENALKGVNGIDKITRIDTEPYSVHLAGELKNFNIEDHIDKKEARRMDRFTQYAIVAAREAVKDAQLDINENTADRIGVWIGSGIGGMETFEIAHKQLMDKGPRRVSPFFVPMLILIWQLGKYQLTYVQKDQMVQQLQHVQQVQIQSEKHLKLCNAVMQMQ